MGPAAAMGQDGGPTFESGGTMSDDQGDAEFEASLAGIDQGAPGPAAAPPPADTQRALAGLRADVEELARRMGAGFREDLAQIRAIVTAISQHDPSDELRALRAEVGRLATADAVSGVSADLAPLQASLDRLASRLEDDSGRSQVLARFQALESKLDALAAAGEPGPDVSGTLDSIVARIDELATARQVGNLAGDLRAHLTDALGGFDGDTVLAEIAGIRSQLGNQRGTVVEQLEDHLADVASGEVVGALWDEVRAVRASLDALDGAGAGDDVTEAIAGLRAEVEGIAAAVAATTEPVADPAVVAMRDDVQALTDEVRALTEAVLEPVEEDEVEIDGADVELDDEELGEDPLIALTEELATLRADLAEGLVVEPSDALSASLDALRSELDDLHASLADLNERQAAPAPEPTPPPAPPPAPGPSADFIAAVHDELAAVRSGIDELRERTEQGAPGEETRPEVDVVAVLREELVSVRAGIDELGDRIHQGLDVDPGTLSAETQTDVDVLADQMAALRDLVTSEIDGLRQAVISTADARPAPAPAPPAAPAAPAAGIDPEALAELRDEIRAAGGVSDQTVDALRDELKALRRRIAVKASERVLDDQQLAQIADAVAERLGRDRS